MRRMFTRILSLAAVAMLPVSMAQPAQAEKPVSSATRSVEAPAYFEMADGYGYRTSTFVVKLTGDSDIEHARELVRGETTERPHLLGRIRHFSASYNPRWSFHFEPESVRFFDVAIEVCDASAPYVEDHLDEAGGAFLPGNIWCPWSSRLVREIPRPDAG
jgi:hypothetical protein